VSTFIERHGYVRYPVPGYNRVGPCEVRGCAQREFENKLHRIYIALAQLQHISRLPAQIIDGLQWQKWPQWMRGLAKEYLQGQPITCDLIWAEMIRDLTSPDSYLNRKVYVVDHCHSHGWIRGIVCQSCNTVLSIIDAGKLYRNESALAFYGMNSVPLQLEKHRLNCPECAGNQTPQRQYVSSEYLAQRAA